MKDDGNDEVSHKNVMQMMTMIVIIIIIIIIIIILEEEFVAVKISDVIFLIKLLRIPHVHFCGGNSFVFRSSAFTSQPKFSYIE
jgi:hypothetical protein